MTEKEVCGAAEEVLGPILGGVGFKSVDVRLGADHDGDASFFVTVYFKPNSGVTGGDVSMRAHSALWTRLLRGGEERFPYLEFRYPDDEILVDDDEGGQA